MPDYDANAPLRLPLLDRLLDDEPKIKSEAPMSRSTSLARLKIAVRRDLENLLLMDPIHEVGDEGWPEAPGPLAT